MPMKSFASEIGKEWLFECQKTIKQIGIKEENIIIKISGILLKKISILEKYIIKELLLIFLKWIILVILI